MYPYAIVSSMKCYSSSHLLRRYEDVQMQPSIIYKVIADKATELSRVQDVVMHRRKTRLSNEYWYVYLEVVERRRLSITGFQFKKMTLHLRLLSFIIPKARDNRVGSIKYHMSKRVWRA